MERSETRCARGGDVSIACRVVGDCPFDLVSVPGTWRLFAVEGA